MPGVVRSETRAGGGNYCCFSFLYIYKKFCFSSLCTHNSLKIKKIKYSASSIKKPRRKPRLLYLISFQLSRDNPRTSLPSILLSPNTSINLQNSPFSSSCSANCSICLVGVASSPKFSSSFRSIWYASLCAGSIFSCFFIFYVVGGVVRLRNVYIF